MRSVRYSQKAQTSTDRSEGDPDRVIMAAGLEPLAGGFCRSVRSDSETVPKRHLSHPRRTCLDTTLGRGNPDHRDTRDQDSAQPVTRDAQSSPRQTRIGVHPLLNAGALLMFQLRSPR